MNNETVDIFSALSKEEIDNIFTTLTIGEVDDLIEKLHEEEKVDE